MATDTPGAEASEMMSGPVVWRPTDAQIDRSRLTDFMRRHGLASLEELNRRSTTDVAWFWDTILKDLGIEFHTPYTGVLDAGGGIERPRWCVGGQMNIVQNLLDRYADTPTDRRPAIRFELESGTVGQWTYGELRERVNALAAGLRAQGLGRGDVVGVFMPMVPEIVVAMLAVIKIGGIFLPLFSGYGAEAIASRLADGGAKALITADGCHRRGVVTLMKPTADEAVARVPSVRRVVVFKTLDTPVVFDPARDVWWSELVHGQPENTPTEITGADDPMMLIYTSGTTGKPKGAVHTHCGFPIKTAQDMLHGFDVSSDDVIYWMTDMGWMMGPWLVFGTLLLGATMVVYDGAPDFPGPGRLWEIVDRHRVTMLGVSPTLIRALMKHGETPLSGRDLSSLRKFGSTGEPWNPKPWMWLFENVGHARLPILNYSGGTEISGGILCGNMHTPLRPCAFAGPLPGMAVDVVNESGRSVQGEVGELVIRAPWIGMTRGFWNDHSVPTRYHEAYWSQLPGVWVHGDWAVVTDDGLWWIMGRSDDTLKIAGKRLGPAEVESILVGHPAITEAAAIGVPDEIKGEALVCFCVARTGTNTDDALKADLRARIIRDLGKPLAPKDIRFVTELPKTRNGKIMRRIIRSVVLGKPPGDLSALENPGALAQFKPA